MPKNNLKVNFNTKNGRVLARFYDRILQGLLQRIEGFDPDEETFDVLQAEVDGVLDEAEAVSVNFSNVELPDNYAKGIDEANKILETIGVNLTSPDIGAHETVVQQMIGEMNVNFGKNINAVRNGIRGAINSATRQRLQDVFAGTVSRAESKKKAVDILRQNGVQSIIDRGGKTWSLDTYVNMLSRTTARAAFNQGVVNRSLEVGVTVFRVSFTGTEHEECARWERALVSSNGEFGLPTIDEATSEGLFHPNCFHVVLPDPLAQNLLEEGDADARMFAN